MEKKNLTIKDSSIGLVTSFLFSQIAVVIVYCIGYIISSMIGLASEDIAIFFSNCYGYALLAFAMQFTIAMTYFFFSRNKDNKIISAPKSKKLLVYIIIAIASFFTLYPLINCIDSLLQDWGIRINTISYELNSTSYIVSLFSLVILPAICEELLFRGLIFKGLKPYGKYFSIIVSALLFAIYHMSLSQAVYPFLLGLLLSLIMYHENNIVYCIAVHMTNNFLSLTLSYANISLVFNHWTYLLLALVLFAMFIVAVMYFMIKKVKSTEKTKISREELIYFTISITIMIVFYVISCISN